MARSIRKSTIADIDSIMLLIDCGKQIMRDNGNMEQWNDGYPNRKTILTDVANGNSYLILDDEEPIATFAFIKGPDPSYLKIYDGHWTNEEPYYVVHRIASKAGKHHVFKDLMDFCFSIAAHIRIDTHPDNTIMQHVILQYGFTYCGIIHLLRGGKRLAYLK
jgi:meiotically up-regulated gene 157 (Mug157) protein